jgi:beta-glucosidase
LAVLLVAIVLAAGTLRAAPAAPPYLDAKKPMDARIADLLGRLTLEEKDALVHAQANFCVAGVPRLGISELWMDDGPLGVRAEAGEGFRNAGRTNDFATAMPAALGLAATFDTNLARAYGAVIGQEAKQRGKNIMLGPSLNIQRTPLGGRSFEYMGEDPFLTSRMAVGYILGEQAQGVGSCAKHFAMNNQEYQRNSINVEADERAVREIYLPAFRAAVQEAGVLSVMGAYNKFRGTYCCENDYLLNQVLKGDWGFPGLVMSDWGGVHTTDGAAKGGMDMEMGSGAPYNRNRLGDAFVAAIQTNRLPMSLLDDKVRRHLYVMFKLNLVHDPAIPVSTNVPATSPTTKAHQETARQIAEQAIVLLKNDHDFLPLDAHRLKTIAVVGANANAQFALGGGSAEIKAPYEITALAGISNRAGAGVKIIFAPGYALPAGRGGFGRRGGAAAPAPAPANEELSSNAVEAAKSADIVIYVGGLNHNTGDAEGGDRRDLKLPGGQDDLLQKIVAANPKTVVVFNGGGAVEMGAWLAQAPALLYAWYGGLENGNALARVLFGDVNPSAKLPCTFPKQLADSPAHALNAYPQTTNGTVEYKEGLFVGYRWFDSKNIEPLFPFGYGLSYTRFKYSNLKVARNRDANNPVVTVTFTVENTGPREGAEVAEVYVHEAVPTVERPVKELKGFAKVALKPGQKKTVTVTLTQSAFAYYSPEKKAWVANRGDFDIEVGGSSRDLQLHQTCSLPQTVIVPD